VVQALFGEIRPAVWVSDIPGVRQAFAGKGRGHTAEQLNAIILAPCVQRLDHTGRAGAL
jgi:hypothetical protein